MENDEKKAFSERLKLALRRSTKPIDSPTELALQFNLRDPDEYSVTPQAAQKWLTGKAKPTHAKIQILADWLGVSAHWLSYGEPDVKPVGGHKSGPALDAPLSAAELSEEESALIQRYRKLSAARRTLVKDLVVEFALEQEVWPDSK